MERVKVQTRDLTNAWNFDGIDVREHFKSIEKFYGIPAALHTVDNKFKTSTYLEVVRAATPELNFIVDDNNVQLLDPKSEFVTDEQFDYLVEEAEKVTGSQVDVVKRGFQKSITIDLPMNNEDVFMNDAFQRQWVYTRHPQGGSAITTQIIRLACTNGMTVPDKQYIQQFRKALPAADVLKLAYATSSFMSINKYLEEMFSDHGEMVPCSAADMFDMQAVLARLTESEDLANNLFPSEGVKAFYQAQGIDCDHLARKWLDKLPTGLSYYQALQILTNGAKRMVTPTIANQLEIAKFCAPKRIKNLKDTNLFWSGTPQWSEQAIHQWMGDVA